MEVVDKGSAAPSCSRHIELAVWPDGGGGRGGEKSQKIDDLSGVTVSAMKTSQNLFMTRRLLPPLPRILQAVVAGFHALLTDLMQRENREVKQWRSVGEVEDKRAALGERRTGRGGGFR